jgi:hypothetical protein
LDYLRHNGLKDPICNSKYELDSPNIDIQRDNFTQWWLKNGSNAIKLVQFYLNNVDRIYIFGEPYENGLGVHNVHMTQGDPMNSVLAIEDGIWQNGGVMFEYTKVEPHISILLTKFETQSFGTDQNGRPL